MKGQRKSKSKISKEGDYKMGVSDRIEAFINELLKDEEWTELKRNELASIFDCVPSQINYVISTRFSPERGYAVESRRGGGGYLRIRRLESDNLINSIIRDIGTSLDFGRAVAYVDNLLESHIIDEKTAKLIISAVSDNSLIISQPAKDQLRAVILKNMLSSLD